jgi:hypothetical protein
VLGHSKERISSEQKRDWAGYWLRGIAGKGKGSETKDGERHTSRNPCQSDSGGLSALSPRCEIWIWVSRELETGEEEEFPVCPEEGGRSGRAG